MVVWDVARPVVRPLKKHVPVRPLRPCDRRGVHLEVRSGAARGVLDLFAGHDVVPRERLEGARRDSHCHTPQVEVVPERIPFAPRVLRVVAVVTVLFGLRVGVRVGAQVHGLGASEEARDLGLIHARQIEGHLVDAAAEAVSHDHRLLQVAGGGADGGTRLGHLVHVDAEPRLPLAPLVRPQDGGHMVPFTRRRTPRVDGHARVHEAEATPSTIQGPAVNEGVAPAPARDDTEVSCERDRVDPGRDGETVAQRDRDAGLCRSACGEPTRVAEAAV